jgi:hypothetical protein
MKKFKFYAFNLKLMGSSEPSQDTSMDTSLFNMFKVLECLVLKFVEARKPVNYTAIEECAEKLDLHGSRYIYAALRKARNLGYVRFIERRSSGTWKLYVPTMRGIVAVFAFGVAYLYGVPELYDLVMDHIVSWARLTVETLRRWRDILDKEGINYDKEALEGKIRAVEYILSAFKEETLNIDDDEALALSVLSIVPMLNALFDKLTKYLKQTGVPKETLEEIVSSIYSKGILQPFDEHLNL